VREKITEANTLSGPVRKCFTYSVIKITCTIIYAHIKTVWIPHRVRVRLPPHFLKENGKLTTKRHETNEWLSPPFISAQDSNLNLCSFCFFLPVLLLSACNLWKRKHVKWEFIPFRSSIKYKKYNQGEAIQIFIHLLPSGYATASGTFRVSACLLETDF